MLAFLPIDKDVPIPQKAAGGRKKGPYINCIPWKLMEVNDSVFVKESQHVVRAKTSNVIYRTGWKFTIRNVDGGCRIWRIE